MDINKLSMSSGVYLVISPIVNICEQNFVVPIIPQIFQKYSIIKKFLLFDKFRWIFHFLCVIIFEKSTEKR